MDEMKNGKILNLSNNKMIKNSLNSKDLFFGKIKLFEKFSYFL